MSDLPFNAEAELDALITKNSSLDGSSPDDALAMLIFSIWKGVEEWGTTGQKEMYRIGMRRIACPYGGTHLWGFLRTSYGNLADETAQNCFYCQKCLTKRNVPA